MRKCGQEGRHSRGSKKWTVEIQSSSSIFLGSMDPLLLQDSNRLTSSYQGFPPTCPDPRISRMLCLRVPAEPSNFRTTSFCIPIDIYCAKQQVPSP